jgi:outer membrane protein insertion porin family
LFARTFDAQKLEADKEIIRSVAYQEKGYFKATVSHHDLNIRDATGRSLFPLPLVFKKGGKRADITMFIEEGKQFFVRRINFSGNDTTRDKVIRRELMLDEGDMFNTRLWDLSVLRLNQLGYFEPLKEEDATEIRRDTRNGLVDLTLKVKERGKNTVNLNGGVSGFAGSFIGFGYSTNNFLGLGETLTFETQLGSRERVLLFGFTEPYLFDKPIQAGFTVFTRRFSFNQGREASIFAGQNLIPLFEALGKDNFLDYRQTSAGFTTYASTPAAQLRPRRHHL